MSGGQRSRLALAALVTRRPALRAARRAHQPPRRRRRSRCSRSSWSRCPASSWSPATTGRSSTRSAAAVVDLDPPHLGVDGAGGNRFTGGYTDYLRRQARPPDAAGRRRSRPSRTSSTGCASRRAPRPGRSRTTARRGTATSSSTTSRAERRPHRQPPGEGRRAPHRGARARPGPQAARAARRSAACSRRPPSARARWSSVRDLRGRRPAATSPGSTYRAGGRLLVTGANGSGKSTLLKVLAGRARARPAGSRRASPRAGSATSRRTWCSPAPTAPPPRCTTRPTGSPVPLARPRPAPPAGARPARSGCSAPGSSAGSALAILVARAPDLLLLDEPTNHISLALADELEESLQGSPGTVVVASHDRWLRRRWKVPGKTVRTRCPRWPERAIKAA